MSNKHKLIAEKSLQKEFEISLPSRGILKKIKVSDALELASKASRGGRFGSAMAIYEQIVCAVPKFPLPYFLLAKVQLQSGNRKLARELVVRALEISVGSADYFLRAGNLFADLYENELSFSLIEKAFKLASYNPEILTFYAMALAKRDDSDQAVKYLIKAIGIAPEYAGAYLMLATIAPSKIDNVVLENINRMIEGLESSDRQVQLLFAAAKAYALRGDYAKEFQYLDRANATIRSWTAWTWQADYESWK